MNKHIIKAGQQYVTNGGWRAVVCSDTFCDVWHEINGGVLYSHNKDGSIRSATVGEEYSLKFLLTPIEVLND